MLLIVLGLARVVPAIVDGEVFGTEASVAAIMLVAGIATLLHVRLGR